MLGGFLKHMNDSLQSNRDLRKHKVDLKELYWEQPGDKKHRYKISDIQERIKLHRLQDRSGARTSLVIRIVTIIVVLMVIIASILLI